MKFLPHRWSDAEAITLVKGLVGNAAEESDAPWSAQLLWVPVDRQGQLQSTDPRGQDFARYGFAKAAGAVELTSHLPGDSLLSTDARGTFLPFWIVRRGVDERGIVDSQDGRLVLVDFRAQRLRARLRLLLLFLLFSFGLLYYTDLASTLARALGASVRLTRINNMAALGPTVLASFAGLVLVSALIFFAFRRTVFVSFREPLERAVHGRLRNPQFNTEIPILRQFFFVTSLLLIVTSIDALLSAWSFFSLTTLFAGNCVFLWGSQLAGAMRSDSENKALMGSIKKQPATSNFGHNTQILATLMYVLVVVAFASFAVSFFSAIFVGMLQQNGPFIENYNGLKKLFIELAAILAVAASEHQPRNSRITLISLAAVWLGKFLWGPIGGFVGGFVLIGLGLILQGEGNKTVLHGALRFALAATLGRLLGRLLGALFVGLEGAVIGEIFGELLLGFGAVASLDGALGTEPLSPQGAQLIARFRASKLGVFWEKKWAIGLASGGLLGLFLLLPSGMDEDALAGSLSAQTPNPSVCTAWMPPARSESRQFSVAGVNAQGQKGPKAIHDSQLVVDEGASAYIVTALYPDRWVMKWDILALKKFFLQRGFVLTSWQEPGLFSMRSQDNDKTVIGVFVKYFQRTPPSETLCVFFVEAPQVANSKYFWFLTHASINLSGEPPRSVVSPEKLREFSPQLAIELNGRPQAQVPQSP